MTMVHAKDNIFYGRKRPEEGKTFDGHKVHYSKDGERRINMAGIICAVLVEEKEAGYYNVLAGDNNIYVVKVLNPGEYLE